MLDGQATISSTTCVYGVLLESTRQYWETMNVQGVTVASTPRWLMLLQMCASVVRLGQNHQWGAANSLIVNALLVMKAMLVMPA